MRVFRVFLLVFSLSFLTGCAATQQNFNPDKDLVVEGTQQDDGVLRLVKPADGQIFSDYGPRKRISRNKKKSYRMHSGIDIAAKRGSDVVAAAGGTVVFSGRQNGYGRTVKIDHGNDRVTLYAHMDKVFVTEGQKLAQGERLGVVGRTGRTTGPHLHFELLVSGRRTNPVPAEGWAEPTRNIAAAAAPAKAIAPPADIAVADKPIPVKAEVPGEPAVVPASKPENSLLAFFRSLVRPSGGSVDSAQGADESPQQSAL